MPNPKARKVRRGTLKRLAEAERIRRRRRKIRALWKVAEGESYRWMVDKKGGEYKVPESKIGEAKKMGLTGNLNLELQLRHLLCEPKYRLKK